MLCSSRGSTSCWSSTCCLDPWPFDGELYERRNEIGRLFGRIKRFRRVCTRCGKTDLMFGAFVTVAFIAGQLR